jgi:hypothetical protein
MNKGINKRPRKVFFWGYLLDLNPLVQDFNSHTQPAGCGIIAEPGASMAVAGCLRGAERGGGQ